MSRLASIAGINGDRPAAWVGAELLDLRRAFTIERIAIDAPVSLVEIIADAELLEAVERLVRRIEDASFPHRDRLREAGALLSGEQKLAPPVRPRLIVCCGHTYASHAREMGATPPNHPAGFIKSSHTVIAPGEAIVLPDRHAEHVDFEGEFACVIGRRCHGVGPEDALAHVAGYVVVNDVSARDWVEDARRTGDMFFNTLGKQFPTFCPLGPCLATAGEIPDPHAVRLSTKVNSELMQDASTAELTFSIPQLVAFWSQWYEFQPGDVITTGSPPGVGASRSPPVYLRDGDEVIIEASGVGALRNPVRGPGRSAG